MEEPMGYRDDGGKNDERQLMQLRQMNSLLYYRPSQSSLFSERQQKIQPFQTQNVQPGGTAQIIINSDDFVYGPTSFLKVDLTITIPANQPGAVGVGIGYTLADIWGQNGSILNIFQGVRLSHRSGEQLETQNFYLGQHMNIKRWYLYNESERAQLDDLLNQNYTNIFLAVNAVQTISVTAMVPLSLMLGVFAEHTQIIPNWLLSGAKLELLLNTNVTALGVGGNVAYSNVNFNLLLDSVRVYDSVKKQISEEMTDVRSSGIQFVYESTYQTSTNVVIGNAVSTGFSFDINQANSIVKNAYAVFMLSADLNTQVGIKNAFRNVVSTLQARLGSHYMPSQQMTLTPYTVCGTVTAYPAITAAPNSQQAFQNTINCFESQSKQFSSYLNTNSVTIEHFASTAGDSAKNLAQNTREYDRGNLSVYGFLLDRAPQGLAYSGPPTNNSRLLNINGFLIGDADVLSATGVMIVWTNSTRVASLIGDSCVVDR